MLKRDPYNHEVRWQKWKQENQAGIKEISKHNSDLILAYLMDMEMGKNVSAKAIKGERSCCRLNCLKSRLIFLAKQFKDKELDKLTKDDIHKFVGNYSESRINIYNTIVDAIVEMGILLEKDGMYQLSTITSYIVESSIHRLPLRD